MQFQDIVSPISTTENRWPEREIRPLPRRALPLASSATASLHIPTQLDWRHLPVTRMIRHSQDAVEVDYIVTVKPDIDDEDLKERISKYRTIMKNGFAEQPTLNHETDVHATEAEDDYKENDAPATATPGSNTDSATEGHPATDVPKGFNIDSAFQRFPLSCLYEEDTDDGGDDEEPEDQEKENNALPKVALPSPGLHVETMEIPPGGASLESSEIDGKDSVMVDTGDDSIIDYHANRSADSVRLPLGCLYEAEKDESDDEADWDLEPSEVDEESENNFESSNVQVII